MKAERQQQRVEELCGACIRALTGQPDLRYRGRRLHKGLNPIPIRTPHLRTDPGKDDFQSYRGSADGIVLRLQLSDPELHMRLSPEDKIQRFVFELLEQLRVESLVPERFPGMKRNIRHRFTQWSLGVHYSGLTETHIGVLLYTLAQVAWAQLNGYPVLEETDGLIETTRFNLMPLIGTELAGLKQTRGDQGVFAVHALKITGVIAEMAVSESKKEPGESVKEDDQGEPSELAAILDFESDDDPDVIAAAATGESSVFTDMENTYRVFTTCYDREVEAASLVREVYLRELRQRLDKRIRGQGINIARLARRLSSLLSAPRTDGWSFGEEEGYIDGRRLSQLVASPAERRLFRREQYRPHANCLVSILIDCSGSMKAHIEPVTVLVDVLGRALELAEVNTEILGYTTGAWNGGRCQLEWLGKGRPQHPGRLNEICHMVFKNADTSWRRARTDIAALLKADLFREGIDGEAAEWACHRMIGRSEERRILIVISDGCPMDTATGLANDRYYLDNHLKQVVNRLESNREVEVYGLGVGLDLSPYYTNCLALDLSETLSNQVFEEILHLLAGRHHR